MIFLTVIGQWAAVLFAFHMTFDWSAFFISAICSTHFAVSCFVTLTFATGKKAGTHLVCRRVLAIVLIWFCFYDFFYAHIVFISHVHVCMPVCKHNRSNFDPNHNRTGDSNRPVHVSNLLLRVLFPDSSRLC